MLKVLAPGVLTTVQDRGRFGFAKYGVGPSGAMDQRALRITNLLLGNDDGAAALEVTAGGLRLEFMDRAVIAAGGADVEIAISGVEVPAWRAVHVQKGAVLELGSIRWGWRTYVAVAGGVDVPVIMGSRSTHARSGFGGLDGRALRAGDILRIGRTGRPEEYMHVDGAGGPVPFALSDRFLDDPARLYNMDRVRIVRGPHWDMLDDNDAAALVSATFHVSERSDRMGYRLSGRSLGSVRGTELISTAVTTGTMQVPPGGEPILLLADRQTTGGYPMVAHVITADLGAVGQIRPGDEIRFTEVSLGEARRALMAAEEVVDEIKGAGNGAPSRP